MVLIMKKKTPFCIKSSRLLFFFFFSLYSLVMLLPPSLHLPHKHFLLVLPRRHLGGGGGLVLAKDLFEIRDLAAAKAAPAARRAGAAPALAHRSV